MYLYLKYTTFIHELLKQHRNSENWVKCEFNSNRFVCLYKMMERQFLSCFRKLCTSLLLLGRSMPHRNCLLEAVTWLVGPNTMLEF